MSINLCKQYVHFDAVHTTQTHGEKGQEKKRQVGNMGLTYTHSLLYWAAYKENYKKTQSLRSQVLRHENPWRVSIKIQQFTIQVTSLLEKPKSYM